jgi:tripartite-type tricarboxylate transporter receptor subunit TctC
VSHRSIRTLCVLAALALTGAQPSIAQSFPARPIKIITPFAAGQGPDILARLVADKMAQELGKAVIVENKPGASGFIAFQAAKAAPADGYTMVQMDSFHIGTQPTLFKKLPYDAFKDFDPVTPLVRNYFFVVVPSTSTFKTIGDLVSAAKAKPGVVSYGSWAVASPGHLGGLLLESKTGTQMTHVPYKETPMLYQSVANGEVDWAIGSAASTSALLQAGKVRFLAAAAPKRIAGYETVPTVGEGGGPANFEVGGWNGFLVPHGTPTDVTVKLNAAVQNAMKSPDIAARLAQFTYEAYTMSPAQMAELMQTEPKKWSALITAANIKLD